MGHEGIGKGIALYPSDTGEGYCLLSAEEHQSQQPEVRAQMRSYGSGED